MSILSTIYHYASLALQRNFLLVCFLLQLSWKEYPPRSNLYGVLKPSIKNWLWGKVSSIFVSEIISISILPLIWSLSNSNLFLMEFMFKWANINLLTLSLRIDFRVLSQKLSCSASNDTSELHSSKFLLELFLNCQLKTLEISLMKALLKIVDPFLFKLSLPLLIWCDLIFWNGQ